MKRKTDADGTKLQELRAKALRRGDKLVNTLRKLADKADPNDTAVEPLLKALKQALPQLRRLSGEKDGTSAKRGARRVQRASGKAGHEPPFPSKSKRRKGNQPAPAPAVAR